MTDDLLSHVAALLATDYILERELGRGGMAVVYAAIERARNRRVAIKVLPPELAFAGSVRERFLREARISAALDHPGIVPIYHSAHAGNVAYILMRYVDGETLAERLAREGRLSIDEVRLIIGRVADALDFAHAAGVVHRDIKPNNIIIESATGRPMVMDFGIARTLHHGDPALTTARTAIGTPTYMSPEQAIGDRALDARSDIYSLGVVAYQLIAGVPPFEANNTPALMVKHTVETPRSLRGTRPETPEWLERAVMRALAKQPNERFQTAAQFRDAMGDIAGVHMTPAVRIVPRASNELVLPQTVRKRVDALRKKAVGSGALLVALLGLMAASNHWGDSIVYIIGALLGLDFLIEAQRLWGDGVPVREIVRVKLPARQVRQQMPTTAPLLAAGMNIPPPAYVSAASDLAIDHDAIVILLSQLTDAERTMIPDVRSVIESLKRRVSAVHTMLASLDEQMLGATSGAGNVATAVDDETLNRTRQHGTLTTQMEECAEALFALRLSLKSVIGLRFQDGLEDVVVNTERVKALSQF